LQQTDLQKIGHFIRENKNPGDVLSLVIQRELSILTPELFSEGYPGIELSPFNLSSCFHSILKQGPTT